MTLDEFSRHGERTRLAGFGAAETGFALGVSQASRKVRDGEAPSPTREARVLPGTRCAGAPIAGRKLPR